MPELRVVTEEGYPIHFTDPDTGELTGFATEFVHTVLAEAELEYSIKSYSWTRAFKIATEEPNVLIYTMARTPEREDQFNWLFQIMTLNYFLYANDTRTEELSELDNYKNYRVAVVAGSVTQKYLEQDGYDNLILAQNYQQIHNLIQRDRVDLVASSEFGMKNFAQKFAYDANYFKAFKPLNVVEIGLYYALSKESDPSLLAELRQAFETNKDKLIIPR